MIASLPPLSDRNFCEQLGLQQHLDVASPVLSALKPTQRSAITGLDQLRNINPRVHRCERSGDVLIFHKEAALSTAQQQDRLHVYGAIRFLKGAFSSFQIVRATSVPPSEELLDTIGMVVGSLCCE